MKYLYANVAALVSLALAGPIIRDAPGILPPHEDPFYERPENLESYELGDVISHREFPQEASDVDFGLPHKLYQVKYRTSDWLENPSWTLLTIVEPNTKHDPPRILSHQFYEDSVNIDCSPSYSMISSIAPDNLAAATLDVPIIGDLMLYNGYTIIYPDHQGPNSSFISGHTEARATLDGLRAAVKFLKYPKDTPMAMLGYSGGSHATSWASALAHDYAPELNIVGAISGGIPNDLQYIIEKIDGTLFSGFVLAGWTGAIKGRPDLYGTFAEIVQQKFLDDMDSAGKNGICEDEILLSYFFQNFTALFKNKEYEEKTGHLIWDFPVLHDYIRNESLIPSRNSLITKAPQFPMYIFHSSGDEVMPFHGTYDYVHETCKFQGANIVFDTFPQVPEHTLCGLFGIPQGLKFLLHAMNGTLTQGKCGEPTPGGPASLFDPAVLSDLGYDIVLRLAHALNIQIDKGGLVGELLTALKDHGVDVTNHDGYPGDGVYKTNFQDLKIDVKRLVSGWPSHLQKLAKDKLSFMF